MRTRFSSPASLSFIAYAAIAIASSTAHATPTFPNVIQTHLKAPSAPTCEVCHVGQKASGTVTTLFGVSMRGRGLVKFDETSLRTALDALRAEKTDSNKDGTTDIDALTAGSDPNASSGDGGAGIVSAAPIEYGCANMSGQSRTRTSRASLYGSLALLAVAVMRRRLNRS
jgi:hypothetical protein